MADPRPPVADFVRLRPVTAADLPAFFEQQLDAAANHMAAFTREDPSDREAFAEHWNGILGDAAVTARTILFDGRVAGHVASFGRLGKLEVTYWIGRDYWGKGIATEALSRFLRESVSRPLVARAAKDNVASIRVLEKCGFTLRGYERCFAHARGREIEEAILILD